MKKLILVFVGMVCIPMLAQAQEEPTTDYKMVELDYIKVKPGMEAKFEEAVKKHNDKFHAKAPYESSLSYITTGNEAGWYVWIMGSFTFTDLDGAPAGGAHMDDWRKTIAPYVEEYGRTEFWRYNDKFSVANDKSEPMEVLWFIDVEKGEFYRFKAFMEKVQKVYKNKNEEMQVWMNQFNQGDGRDVAISWPIDNWAALDKDDWKMKDEFDKEFGEGAWDNALDEWDDIIKGVRREVWRHLM